MILPYLIRPGIVGRFKKVWAFWTFWQKHRAFLDLSPFSISWRLPFPKSSSITLSISINNSIMQADWSAHHVGSCFPFQWTSAERRMEVACPKAAHIRRSQIRGSQSTSFLSPLVGILSGAPSRSSSHSSSGFSFLQVSDTQLPLLKNFPTMTTL